MVYCHSHDSISWNIKLTWRIYTTSVIPGPSIRVWAWMQWKQLNRVDFLPEEMYFFRDTRRKQENSYFFQFIPEEIGRNGRYWKNYTFSIGRSEYIVWNNQSEVLGLFLQNNRNWQTILRWWLEFCISILWHNMVKHCFFTCQHLRCMQNCSWQVTTLVLAPWAKV